MLLKGMSHATGESAQRLPSQERGNLMQRESPHPTYHFQLDRRASFRARSFERVGGMEQDPITACSCIVGLFWLAHLSGSADFSIKHTLTTAP